MNLDQSLYNILQILSVTLFEKMPIQQAFEGTELQSQEIEESKQLKMF